MQTVVCGGGGQSFVFICETIIFAHTLFSAFNCMLPQTNQYVHWQLIRHYIN